ncbi:MAG: phosphatidate cytidylyltransferase [Lentisphaeria bacterium]|nr:phosphatidate cytidylyltransferase [Lentisphaeria bacterium]
MFIKRLFSTIILLGLFGASIFAPTPYSWFVFLLLCCLLTFTLVLEVCNIVKNIGMETYRYFGAGVCTLIAAFAWTDVFELSYFYVIVIFGIILTALYVPLFILFSRNSGERIRRWFNTLIVSAFVMLPVFLIICIYAAGVNIFPRTKFNYYFLVFVLLSKIGDIGAYVVGTVSNKLMKGGNHKMVPSISPGKSWEGAVGGLTLTVLLAIGFHYWLPELLVFHSIELTIVTGVCMFFGSVAGDLMESVLKRAAGVKDSGTTIPGIGGVFDLVDSLFVTAPVASIIFFAAQNFYVAF